MILSIDEFKEKIFKKYPLILSAWIPISLWLFKFKISVLEESLKVLHVWLKYFGSFSMFEALIKLIEINQKNHGSTVLDAPSSQFINEFATFFKEKSIIIIPKLSPFVKCSRANDCELINPDYIYYKAAQNFEKVICHQNP